MGVSEKFKIKITTFHNSIMKLLVLFLFTLPQITIKSDSSVEEPCSDGYELNNGICAPPGFDCTYKEDGSCYLIVDSDDDRDTARNICKASNSHLVVIETEREHDQIVELIRNSGIIPSYWWTAGHNPGSGWTWLTEKTGKIDLNYNPRWASYSNNKKRNSLSLRITSGLAEWYNYATRKTCKAICEYNITSSSE